MLIVMSGHTSQRELISSMAVEESVELGYAVRLSVNFIQIDECLDSLKMKMKMKMRIKMKICL